jgi:general secretion pathway protein D
MVDDGKTIVLGGLIDDGLQQTNQKVPILGDIPLLGRLFRYDRTTKMKRNLIIFLRPVILRDAAVQGKITEGKYSYIRARQLDMRNRGIRLMDNQLSPVLPKKLTGLPIPFENTRLNNSGE